MRRAFLLQSKTSLPTGRVYSPSFPGTSMTVDLGGEWIYPELHSAIVEEATRYDLELQPMRGSAAQTRRRFIFCNDEVRMDKPSLLPVPQDQMEEFRRVMGRINYDITLLTFETGFQQLHGYEFDMSFYDYVLKSLSATGAVKEFLFAQVQDFMAPTYSC